MSEQLLISKRDAAAMLGLSVRSLENLIALKELPSRRIGRRRLIERQALERFVRRDHRTRRDVSSPSHVAPEVREAEEVGR